VEVYENGHHIGIRKPAWFVAVTFPVTHPKGVPFLYLVEKLTKILNLAINSRIFVV